jgi:PAS domain S-box-containing protein
MMRYGTLRILMMYIAVSLLWISFSDQLLFSIGRQLAADHLLWISTGKGYFFVLVNSFFLYFLIRSDDRRLKQSERQYRDMYESNPNPMWIYQPDSLRFVSVNDAAIAIYGYNREEFLKMSILDIRPKEDLHRVVSAAAGRDSNLNQSGSWRHLKKDGREIMVSITSHQIQFNQQEHVLVMARDTTERFAFEQQLEKINSDLLEERQKLRETQLFTKVAGWEFYPTENRLIWSDEVYELTGLNKADGRDAFDIYLQHIIPEDRPMMTAALQQLVTEGKQMDVTHRITALDGTIRYIRQLARVADTHDSVQKIIGSLQDITELKQLENERNKYLYHFEDTLNSISDAFFALDGSMKIIRINETFRKLVVNNHPLIIGESIFDLFPKHLDQFFMAYEQALYERVIVKREDYSAILGKWVRISAFPTDEGVSVYFSDITQDKLKDIQLKQAVERYELVAQATKDVVYDLDIVNDILVYNTSLTQLVHTPISRISYDLHWWRSLIHPDDVAAVVRSQEKIRRSGLTNWECEYRINTGEGEYKYVIDQGYFVYNSKRQPIRLIGAIRDIDALKRSIQENKRLADMIRRVNNMILVTDAGRQVKWVNEAFENQTGFRLSEICGRIPAEILVGPNTDMSVLQDLIQRQLRHDTFGVDIMIYTQQGTPVWVATQLTPAYDEEQCFQGYIIICQNISLRKEKEEEICRQNELLREVAWMSSHEIRRPVATMLGLVDLLNIAETEKDRLEILHLLDRCAHEMDDMVHNINNKIP